MTEKIIGVSSLRNIILAISPEAEYWLETPGTDLLEINALDSMSLIKAVKLLEETFDFNLNVSDLRANHFRSIESLLDLLVTQYGFRRIEEQW